MPRRARSRLAVTPLEDRAVPATHTWTDLGSDNNWSTAGNWTGNSGPTAGESNVVIVYNTTDASTIQNIAGLTIGAIQFNAGAQITLTLGVPTTLDGSAASVNINNAAGNNKITGSTLTLTGATSFIDVATGTSLTVSSAIAGTSGLQKRLPGTLTLTSGGTNTYTGLTTVNGGVLAVGGGFPGDGAIRGNITVNTGGTFRLLQDNIIFNTTAVTVDSGGTFDMNGFGDVVGNLSGGGAIITGGLQGLTLDNLAGTSTFSGVISGTGRLTIRGQVAASGTQVLAGANTYTGGTIISVASIQYTTSTALGTGLVTIGDANTGAADPSLLATGTTSTNLANNVLILDDGGQVGSTDTATANAEYSGTITNSSTAFGQAILRAGSTDRTTFSGRLTGAGIGGFVAFAPNAGRRVVLDNNTATPNDFAGPARILADSVLQLGMSSTKQQIPDSSPVNFVNAGSTLSLLQINETVGGLVSEAAGAGKVQSFSGANTLTIGADNATTTYSGTLINGTGTLALVKTGTGVQTLNNVGNTFTGGLTVRNGTVRYVGNGAVGAGPIALGDAGTPAGATPQLVSGTAGNTTVANPITVNAGGSVVGSNTGVTGIALYTGTLTLNAGVVLQAGSTVRTTFAGQLTGPAGITVTSPTAGRLLVLDNAGTANNFAGGVNIGPGAVLQLNLASTKEQIPDTAGLTFADAGSTLSLFQINETVGGLSSLVTGAGVVNSAGGANTLTVGAGNADSTYSGTLTGGTGTLALVKVGTGALTLAGSATLSSTTVSAGRILVNGTIADGPATPDVLVTGSGALGGNGQIAGSMKVDAGGFLAPGNATTAATLRTGDLTLTATGVYGVKVLGSATGQFDSLAVTGAVNLGGSVLFIPGPAPALPTGSALTIIANDGTDAVVGTFAGIPEGGLVTTGDGRQYRVSYRGGDGNDVVLLPPVVGGFAIGGPGGQVQTVPSASVPPAVAGLFGTARVATADVNGDGVADTVVGGGPGGASRVVVLDGATGKTLADIAPFESTFLGGVFVAAADLNGDGQAEVIVTPDQGGGPVVAIYKADGSQLTRFFGIEDPNFRGGARPAAGDVNKDGRIDLLVAAGFGGGPRLAIFTGQSVLNPVSGSQLPPKLVSDFFVFEQTLRNGVFVASGDLTGDGAAEVVVGGGPNGGPRVFALDGLALAGGTQTVVVNFFAGDPNARGGVRVAVRPAADGTIQLVTGSGENEAARVRVFAAATARAGTAADQELAPFGGAALADGVYVG